MPTYATVLFALFSTAMLAGTIEFGPSPENFPAHFSMTEWKSEIEPKVEAPPSGLCITAGGFCTIRPTQARQPCSCFHPLHGQAPGYAYSVVDLISRPEIIPVRGVDPEAWDQRNASR